MASFSGDAKRFGKVGASVRLILRQKHHSRSNCSLGKPAAMEEGKVSVNKADSFPTEAALPKTLSRGPDGTSLKSLCLNMGFPSMNTTQKDRVAERWQVSASRRMNLHPDLLRQLSNLVCTASLLSASVSSYVRIIMPALIYSCIKNKC